MMWPRLTLLRELLSDGGLIAITIDNNELPNLWLLMDSIFREENLVACAPWLSEPSGGKEKTGLRTGHEYVLLFSKGGAELTQDLINRGELTLLDESGQYLKGRELRKWGGVSLRENRPGQWFALKAPDGTVVWPIRNDGKDGHWRWGPDNPEMKAIMSDPNLAYWELRPFDKGVTWEGLSERWVPYEKLRTSEKPVGWKTWLDDLAYNSDGTQVIKQIFGEKVFDTPKPVELVRWVLSLVPSDSCLVLDSFAGSGTTGHAVLEANAKDGGNRGFILVESEEYADAVTAERVRRVIRGYKFEGTQREELSRKSVTYSTLKNPDKLMGQVEAIENLEGHRFDSIKKEVRDGELIVTGEKNITKRTEGLGGEFTYCTLGDPLDLDKILTGKSLPDYETIGAWLFHTATGEALSAAKIRKNNWYLGESAAYHVWLVYKSDMEFLKSNKAALTLELAEKIAHDPAHAKSGKRHLVFAPAKYVPNKTLLPMRVEYAPLPFALYRVEKD
jgi:adenine-specific DNA-methyltransferase